MRRVFWVEHDGPIKVGQPLSITQVTLQEAISLENAFSLIPGYMLKDMNEEED